MQPMSGLLATLYKERISITEQNSKHRGVALFLPTRLSNCMTETATVFAGDKVTRRETFAREKWCPVHWFSFTILLLDAFPQGRVLRHAHPRCRGKVAGIGRRLQTSIPPSHPRPVLRKSDMRQRSDPGSSSHSAMKLMG